MPKIVVLFLYWLLPLIAFGYSAESQANPCQEVITIPRINKNDYSREEYQRIVNDLLYENGTEAQRKHCVHKKIKFKFAEFGVCDQKIQIPRLNKNDFSSSFSYNNSLRNLIYLGATPTQRRICRGKNIKYQMNDNLEYRNGEIQKKRSNSRKARSKSRDDDSSEDHSAAIEADAPIRCSGECNSNKETAKNKDFLDIINKVKTPNSCKPQGYSNPKMSVDEIRKLFKEQGVEKVTARYAQRAQGMILRGYMALAPNKGHKNYEKLRRLSKDFSNFDSIKPEALKGLLYNKSNKDCYKFVKAAVSGDYSRLTDKVRKESLRANVDLVNKRCRNSQVQGDLMERHWLHIDAKSDPDFSSYAAGKSGPDLEAGGFINILDAKYGIANYFKSKTRGGKNLEEIAPEGALIVYQCTHPQTGPKLYPYNPSRSNGNCHGDIAIKTKQGYLRDFFTPHSISGRGLRKVVGIYIKPEKG